MRQFPASPHSGATGLVLSSRAGLILSTPLTVCVVVLGRYVPQLSFLHVLLGDEVVLGPEAQIYQRLLAMDQREAQAIVDQFLKEKPLLELYDSVLIPALSLAEQDRHQGAIETTREEFLFLSLNEMIVGLAMGAHLLHLPPKWIVVGVICLVGVAIVHGVTTTRQKDPPSTPSK